MAEPTRSQTGAEPLVKTFQDVVFLFLAVRIFGFPSLPKKSDFDGIFAK